MLEVACRAEPNPFQWVEVEHEPKVLRTCLHRNFRTTEYEIFHTGGFIRLCTDRGRIYWLAQNEHDHKLPDWKIHFSVEPRDVPGAWNVITGLFMRQACDFGMKAVAREALGDWPAGQRGRELTVYIFQNHPAYQGGGPMMGLCTKGTEHNFWLGQEFERDSDFWLQFVREAETALAAAGIRSRGVADGDLALGAYASLRNEAFVLGRDVCGDMMPIYPPNAAGWNAAGHDCPLNLPMAVHLKAQALFLLCKLRKSICCHRSRREMKD
mmetsp:Transcript_14955/g.26192  ORF Transcript_14955/g.26192 Transcript_14955/m.26192 type:complete len:268 (+) Transcript_14955:89-892(+)